VIRELDVMAPQADAVDIRPFVKLFASPLVTGAGARELMGTVRVNFPDKEIVGVRLWDDETVRAFLRALHDAIPHLLYFLSPHVDYGAVQAFVSIYMDRAEYDAAREESRLPLSGPVAGKLRDHLVAAARFATNNGDDWRLVVGAHLAGLPSATRDWFISSVHESVSGGSDPQPDQPRDTKPR
jgi:hypothetical protein